MITTQRKIWLSSPHLGGQEKKYVEEAFTTNWVTTLGPNVDGFEAALSSYLQEGVQVAALASGTSAIHLALIVLGVGKDDDVLCQSLTFSASANPIVYQGANPIFIDSEQQSWNLSPELLEQAIVDRIKHHKKPKAIIAVHLYGMPYNALAVNHIARKYEIPVIEDSAEALGSAYMGIKCGALGDLSILSFNGNKIITTSGGGALITKNRSQKETAVKLATQSRDQAVHYQHSEIGYNYRMSNVVAGIGRGQMEVLDERVQQRRANYQYYHRELKEFAELHFLKEPQGSYSNRWLTAIETNSYQTRERIRLALAKADIESRPLWKPMHLQPVFKNCKAYVNGISESLFETGLCLPSGSNLKEEDLEKTTHLIKNTLLQ